MITSTSNPKIRAIQNLNKKAALRRERGVFSVEGIRMFWETPEERIEEAYVSAGFLEGCDDQTRDRLSQLSATVLSDTVFSAISDTRTPQGILLVVRQQEPTLSQLLSGAPAGLLLLETIQDPGNLGTMIRAGEGAGISGIIANRETADLYNPKVIRATMGSIFRVPVVYTEDLSVVLREIRRQGIRVFAAHLKGSCTYDALSYMGPSAFLIGNEASGLREETAALADQTIRIPMLGRVESLNAAVAASVLMYEMARQRRGGA